MSNSVSRRAAAAKTKQKTTCEPGRRHRISRAMRTATGKFIFRQHPSITSIIWTCLVLLWIWLLRADLGLQHYADATHARPNDAGDAADATHPSTPHQTTRTWFQSVPANLQHIASNEQASYPPHSNQHNPPSSLSTAVTRRGSKRLLIVGKGE